MWYQVFLCGGSWSTGISLVFPPIEFFPTLVDSRSPTKQLTKNIKLVLEISEHLEAEASQEKGLRGNLTAEGRPSGGGGGGGGGGGSVNRDGGQ